MENWRLLIPIHCDEKQIPSVWEMCSASQSGKISSFQCIITVTERPNFRVRAAENRRLTRLNGEAGKSLDEEIGYLKSIREVRMKEWQE